MTSGTDLAKQWLTGSPFVAKLGIRVDRIGDGEADLVLPFEASLATMADVVHGGALATLIDTAAAAAAWAGAEAPENLRGSTAAASIVYVGAARGRDVAASARVIRRGRNLVFVEVQATTPDGITIASGLVTYRIG